MQLSTDFKIIAIDIVNLLANSHNILALKLEAGFFFFFSYTPFWKSAQQLKHLSHKWCSILPSLSVPLFRYLVLMSPHFPELSQRH